MNFTTIDLELDQPSKKIIQLGAVVGNIQTGEILEKVSYIISYPDKLSPFIVELTSITDEMIATEGISLYDAYKNLEALHKKHNCFTNCITWGGGDSAELREELLLDPKFEPNNWCFGRRWIDVKTLYVSMAIANNMSKQGGLAKVMTKFGMSFEGRKHWATDDSLNTFRLYRRLLTFMPKINKWK